MNDSKGAAQQASGQKTATLTDHETGESYELPILDGNMGPRVYDVRKLYAQTGTFTYDPGFTSTASCKSDITFIDGDKGQLLHRGYTIQDLAENCDFMEVCYLLLHGELPNSSKKTEFENAITYHTMLHEQMLYFFRGFRRDAHPMAVMVGAVGALSAFYHDSTDITDPHQRMVASHRLIAKMPTIAAMAYKFSVGQPFIYPRNDLSYAENFLYMTFAVPAEEYVVSPTLARAMDRIFILHADHEQNASTSTVRIAGSSGANPFACIAAGIASLWGPAHGGAVINFGTLTTTNTDFTNVQADSVDSGAYGGAIYNLGDLTVRRSTFSGNGTGDAGSPASGQPNTGSNPAKGGNGGDGGNGGGDG